jgi:hypothetical protein
MPANIPIVGPGLSPLVAVIIVSEGLSELDQQIKGSVTSKYCLPDILRREFDEVQGELDADDDYGHISNTSRVRLWRAMDRHCGYHESAMRRAVLTAEIVWPLVPRWEAAMSHVPGSLPSPSYLGKPRSYLASCTRHLMGAPYDLDQACQYLLQAEIETLWLPELEPLCLAIPAILEAGPLIAGARHFQDNEPDEMMDQIWDDVEVGELSEFNASQDWDLLECHFWASEIIAGNLRKPENDIAARKAFWTAWLNDFVLINTRPVDELLRSLNQFVD